MGVPSFFLWLIQKYNIKFAKMLNKHVNKLYIDANCAIHPVCFDTLNLYNKENLDIVNLEKDMIKNVIKYIDMIIHNVNSDYTYIAVDGVAPIAKMQQQRKRRYKSILDKHIINKIKTKHNIIDNIKWDNVVITPGTEFMNKLDIALKEYCNKNDKITYSSYHECGEGEHKILQNIKQTKTNNENYVIYGLDADLIFLAFTSNKNNIYLYREDNDKNNKSFSYIDIDLIKRKYYESINSNNKFNYVNVINDFVVLCFFIGNDFLPNIPSMCIKENGIEDIITNYVYCLNKLNIYLLNDKYEINMIFLELFIENISFNECERFININNKKNKNKCIKKLTPYEYDIWCLDNMQSKYVNEDNTITSSIGWCDKVNMNMSNIDIIKDRYYSYYLGLIDDNDYYEDNIDMIINKYLEGIKWNIKYYFDTCTSWQWYYPYHIAPFFSDIKRYLSKKNVNINNLYLPITCPLKPFQQLLIVLHIEHHKYLPISLLNNIKDNKSLFIQNIKLDTMNKIFFWKCQVFLPIINLDKINELYNNTQFTEEEQNRNLCF